MLAKSKQDAVKALIPIFMLFILLLLSAVLFTPLRMQAQITGKYCSTCHTMHNSQGGAAMVKDATGALQTTPVEFLLNRGGGGKTSCWGCHAQNPSTNVDLVTGAPQVWHTNAIDLAAGNFAYIMGNKTLGAGASLSTAGHNVVDTGQLDATLTSPPGDQNTTGITNANLTCAGQFGCHGNRSAGMTPGQAVKGAHHTKDTVLKFGSNNLSQQGTSIGTSFRFLNGVYGVEMNGWVNTDANNHNEYYGAINKGTESTATAAGGHTISGLCAECHGSFHGPLSGDITSGTGSPWLRHPTDVILPNSGEYTSYNTNKAYSVVAPVARQSIANNLAAPINTVTPGTDVIMCLSCHKAHASANYKIMRWDIKNGTLSTALSGCNVCHTSKN